jgi:hypothetical protein
MQIFVKNNKTFLYIVEQSDTIQSLKEKIFDREAIPDQFYYLSYGGKPLEPTRIFSDYMITEASTILLNFRLAGGKRHSKKTSKKTRKLFSFK